MTGTPKQISWANDIRERWLCQHHNHAEWAHRIVKLIAFRYLRTVPDQYRREVKLVTLRTRRALIRMMSDLHTIDSARWWIDHRGTGHGELIREWMTANDPKLLKRFDDLIKTLRDAGVIRI